MPTRSTVHEQRVFGAMVWTSSADNRFQWTAACERLGHMIVQRTNGTATLVTVPIDDASYAPGRYDTFSAAARAAEERSNAAESGDVTEAVISVGQRLADSATSPDGEHLYLSTACYHGDCGPQGHCRSAVSHAGHEKVPGTCKFCPARCRCECHSTEPE